MTVLTGIISTIAGSSTSGSYGGDDGAATAATLYNPIGVALDTVGIDLHAIFFNLLSRFLIDIFLFSFVGNIHISDNSNNRARKVTVSTGIITTIAGTGTASYSGDGGAATSAALNQPWGIAVDSVGRKTVLILFCNSE